MLEMRSLGMHKWAGILLLLVACSGEHDRIDDRKVFRYNEAANIASLDPAFARDQAIIWATTQIYNGLLQLGDRLEILPCLARAWEISTDGKQYTFHLRNDLYFHDDPCFPKEKGRKVLASDFVFSFNRIIDPAVASPGTWIFNNVGQLKGCLNVLAINDTTLIITLKHPFPPFLGLLTMPYCFVVPHEALEFYGSDFRSHPVGTGPFRFRYWKEGIKLVLIRNHSYFETENGVRLPYLEAVSITFLADKQSAFLEFIKGNLDFMSGIDPGYKDEMLTRSGTLRSVYSSRIRLITQPYLNTEYLGFLMDSSVNEVRNSPVRIKKVRQAINYCFDRRKMIRFLRNNVGSPGMQGIIPKGLPGFDSLAQFYYYDPQKAKQLLTESGFPGGAGLPPIRLVSAPDYLDICKYIQSQASNLGIDLRIEINPPAAVMEMKAQGKLPFFRASWIADYPDAENYLSLFYSPNFCPRGPNYTHFSDDDFDKLYEQSLKTFSDSLRYECYRKMERIVMEESPIVILYYDQVLRFVRKNVDGLGSNPMNLLVLKRVRKH